MTLPYFDLTGKVAVISGGATGIGRGIAEGLAEAGADIVIASRRKSVCEDACSKIAAAANVRTLALKCDVTRSGDAESLVADTISKLGRLDILVNNSGVGGSEKPILEMDEDDWKRVLDTNLKGVFLLSRKSAEHMIANGEGGKIINVVSIGAMIGWPNMSAYCASKGGCLQLTKVMALEWARYDIQVNAILPGYFETPMNREFFSSPAGQQVIKSSIPMRRIAQNAEVKGAAVLLASAASSFMTGAAIVVDGGHTLN